jgi:hypothetical protein
MGNKHEQMVIPAQQYNNANGIGRMNVGAFFWQSGADIRTFSNNNQAVTQTVPRPVTNPIPSPTVPPGFIPKQRSFLSYKRQCGYNGTSTSSPVQTPPQAPKPSKHMSSK